VSEDARYITYAGRRMLRVAGGEDPPADNPPAEAPADPPSDKTFTQGELDRIVGERVGRERQKYADYDDLKTKASEYDKLADSQKTDLDRVSGERDSLKTRVGELEPENLRLRVSHKKGLPHELVDRLQGKDEAEMEADADRLLGLFKPPADDYDGGARPPAGGPEPEPGLGRLAHAYSQTT